MQKVVNTVSAVNQMVNSSELSFLGNENAPLKILVVGNSITRHGPKADIGWNFDWGMAASAPEKDYVHRLYAMLSGSGKDAYMRIRQASYWERNYLSEDCLAKFDGEKDFQADIVVFRLGENVLEQDVPYFKDALRKFIDYICPKTGKVVFTTCFWKHAARDTAIREIAAERGDVCVDIGCTEDRMMALGQFEHQGVAAHPSDYGMENIAKKIFEKI